LQKEALLPLLLLPPPLLLLLLLLLLLHLQTEALNANPDAWSFKLDAAGNLPLKVLDIFANDTGVIVNANVSWVPPDQGDLTWNQQKSYFEYSVTNYRWDKHAMRLGSGWQSCSSLDLEDTTERNQIQQLTTIHQAAAAGRR
jgi:hypothetical protein